MQYTLRQRIMFILFIIVFLILVMMTAYTGNINIILNNLYLILFLGALYLDHSFRSKHVLVLSAAVLIVNVIIHVISNITYITTLKGIIEISAYVGLYFFAMAFLKSSFRNKKNLYLIIGLTTPLLIYSLNDILQRFIAIQGNILINNNFLIFMSPLLNAIFPLSMIIYTILRHKNID